MVMAMIAVAIAVAVVIARILAAGVGTYPLFNTLIQANIGSQADIQAVTFSNMCVCLSAFMSVCLAHSLVVCLRFFARACMRMHHCSNRNASCVLPPLVLSLHCCVVFRCVMSRCTLRFTQVFYSQIVVLACPPGQTASAGGCIPCPAGYQCTVRIVICLLVYSCVRVCMCACVYLFVGVGLSCTVDVDLDVDVDVDVEMLLLCRVAPRAMSMGRASVQSAPTARVAPSSPTPSSAPPASGAPA
jgi:hypothetical protein